jgi:AsmA family protein
MRHSHKILLGLVTIVVLLGVVAAALVTMIDWNRAKPWLAATVGHAIGRTVAIDGDLRVSWQRDPDLKGWRAWLPGPHVSASRVTVGNTDWAKQPVFATADHAEFDLSLLPLLAHTVSVPAVHFVAPDVHFERMADGRANWRFGTNDTGATSAWKFDLGRVQFDSGQLSVADRMKALDVRVHLEALKKSIPFDELVAQQEELSQREAAARVGTTGARQFDEHARKRDEEAPEKHESEKLAHESLQHYAFGFTVEGTFRGNAVKGTGGIGGVLALKHADRPFPLHADVRIGDTRIAMIGTLTDPSDLDALDLRLWLSGKSLAQLYDVLQITLPESPPYATEGHLIGQFTAHAKKLRYEKFTARVGASDLNGDLLYETKEPRPLLSGKVESQRLQFRDLAPMIGFRPVADNEKDNASPDAAPAPTAGEKMLPAAPFRPERWQVMDADVQFTGDHVFRDSELPIHKMDTRIVMDNAVLSLKPLHFSFAYGDVDSSLRLDGRSAPIKGTFDLTARGMQLKRMFKSAEAMNLDLGVARGTANLTASGDSVGALLGAANGEVKAMLDNGTISKALIETAGLNIPNIIITKLFGDKQVKINCAAADFIASTGIFDARLFMIDTDIARINVTGNIDLAHEKLDLVVRPDTKSLRLLSLHSPIHVNGTFEKPEVGIDKGALLARGAGAIGLALVAAPLAALLPLTDTSFGADDSQCATLLDELQKAAPASGKRTH